jgi:hypothetical protein
MNFNLLNKIIAGVVFVISFVVLFSTVQPSVSFWDCGEFVAASVSMQVPHPPGTPFFLLLGNIFSKLPIGENLGYRVNMISVISSALSILLLYLIAVKLIENYKGKKADNLFDAISTYVSAAIGALAFSFSDTFWFNGVEAEVYAFSTFLFAAVTYLIMRWNERADNKDSEKYILMIAYLTGLSTGVHLMSVLALVPVVMIIMFRKYVDDEDSLRKTGYIFLGHAVIILLLAVFWWSGEKTQSPPTQEAYKDFDTKFKIFIVAISALVMGVYWKKVFSRNSFYMPMIIGGIALFATYPGVVKFLPEIMTKIGGDNIVVEMVILVLLFAGLGYGVHYSRKQNKPTLHLAFMSFIFVLVGFLTFATVIIRSNQNPPMDENDPDTFTELVKYLNREQYGDFPTFKRRFATEPHQQIVYSNYSSDLDFFYSYQMNHMMTRYLLWNFAGREGWEQDQGVNIAPFNGIGNIIGKLIGVNFAGETKDSLFGIPFLLGLIGIYFHFRKDWKMASAFMIMFILMGHLTAFYQNQQQPQPRERDYFYVGAFFVYAIWIALGLRGLIDLVAEKIKNPSGRNAASYAILTLGIIFVPVMMLKANYFTHDRSNNWVPWDYSYNLLQSCAPNSVLFTNGDNDTFPLWYLQDVEGVRRDVKVANLSLLNTNWYIKQLKNNDPYKVGTVKFRLNDGQIDQVQPIRWSATKVTVPLPKPGVNASYSDIMQKLGLNDTASVNQGAITWTMNPTLNYGNVQAVRVQDLMVKEIVEANNWERPIYFAVTCSEDSKIGLSDYLRMEGMAFRLVPQKRGGNQEFVEPNILAANLKEAVGYSKDYQPGFKFRGLNDTTIFFDDNHKRMVLNYRNAFLRLSIYHLTNGNKDMAAQVLDDMESKMPLNMFPMEYYRVAGVADLYNRAGYRDKYIKLAAIVEKDALKEFDNNLSINNVQNLMTPFQVLNDLYETQGKNDKLLELWTKLENIYPEDPNVKASVQKYRNLVQGKPDTSKIK